MGNSLNLIPGQKYIVIQDFVDFDHRLHSIGESCTFIETNFLPYDDGLTLHVMREEIMTVYRLRWTQDCQADIIDHFTEYVEPY